MSALPRVAGAHCSVTLTHTGLGMADCLFPTTSSPVPFHECSVQLFSWGTPEWEFGAGKDECYAFYCHGAGAVANTPEAHGKGEREANKSVEAKDAIYMVLSVRNHYQNESTVWSIQTLNLLWGLCCSSLSPFNCSPFNHLESCLTVLRVGLSPRLL